MRPSFRGFLALPLLLPLPVPLSARHVGQRAGAGSPPLSAVRTRGGGAVAAERGPSASPRRPPGHWRARVTRPGCGHRRGHPGTARDVTCSFPRPRGGAGTGGDPGDPRVGAPILDPALSTARRSRNVPSGSQRGEGSTSPGAHQRGAGQARDAPASAAFWHGWGTGWGGRSGGFFACFHPPPPHPELVLSQLGEKHLVRVRFRGIDATCAHEHSHTAPQRRRVGSPQACAWAHDRPRRVITPVPVACPKEGDPEFWFAWAFSILGASSPLSEKASPFGTQHLGPAFSSWQ